MYLAQNLRLTLEPNYVSTTSTTSLNAPETTVPAITVPDLPPESGHRQILALVGFLLACFSVAAVGAAATVHSIPAWYALLHKPGFTPPNWIFAPVWTALYALMAFAAWLVWRSPYLGPTADARSNGLIYFTFQLVINFLWAPVFFHFHRPFFALIIILGLWFAVFQTMRCFNKVSRVAGAIMLLYLAWVSFATLLNAAIFHLN
jgi:tryptophan-rich sensory protein